LTALANTVSISCARSHKSAFPLSFHVNEYQCICLIFSSAQSIFAIESFNLASERVNICAALTDQLTSNGYAGAFVFTPTIPFAESTNSTEPYEEGI
jgi:hypothetical protein